jgi:glucokinase
MKMKACVGIDMGGTSIKIGLVSEGVLIDSAKLPASAHVTLQQRLDELVDPINAMLMSHNADVTGIGLAFPGIVDSRRKKILSRYVKYPDARKVDMAAWAEKAWHVPFAVENDARAALIGEWKYGAGRGCDDLVLITLGTGVGSAAMMGGKLLRGRNYLAGNLGGHMSVNLHGRQCNCGNTGCVESEASTWALKEYVHQLPGFDQSALSREKEINFENVFSWAEKGDALALKVKESALKAWSLGIINLLLAYDPERVIIGGGIMRSKHAIIPFVEEMIKKNTWISDNNIELVAAGQVEHAGILGMSILASDK